MSDVERRVLDLVEHRFGKRPELTEPLSALGVDSVEMADFVGVLEREFRIDVDADILDVDTLEELVRYVESHR